MKKILIAEDDKFLANAYRLKLSKLGFDVRLATDGQEALNILKDFIPDLMILDLVMPNKDGFAVLEEVKSRPDTKSVPVIIASNLGQKEDIDRGLKLGAADYIVKADVAISEIVDKINAVLGAPKK
ncbi:MAG: hypothetical protein UX87_C0033G0005 [Candidatus Amesbacteria bacterium GW2011_GWA1_47_16]|uniref:Response regulatory domain-containing protein n=4 Tax=Candidatus Amesiibacteriota TaxID=1752730 RepID=A0A1F4ZW24_9BACT|nr:MAG: hypothetical protein UX87_C0033G0005 [Candidatus Amesbacteria bacterium GW2011_GWA1_47_16]KKU63281.1 MAG: SC2H12.29, two-component system response regulator [Candidatus Amesbacteria bacterium GW2011_GWC1_47_15]OGC99833.1 MAG: hypothetical protein A2972_05080 [Candidatus Amesbacteria bacterium RIFCSPLOWO2_01_FULL_47_33]OGD09657.1 MAG: hypothetical protein A2395_02700 [Candidatus Amesbacteria bacterium RIFOXYB1_FULL_47_9]